MIKFYKVPIYKNVYREFIENACFHTSSYIKFSFCHFVSPLSRFLKIMQNNFPTEYIIEINIKIINKTIIEPQNKIDHKTAKNIFPNLFMLGK